MSAWHIHNFKKIQEEPLKVFEKSLNSLIPVLQTLTRRCQVVWLNQFPLAESFAKVFCTKCNQEAMERYNLAASRLLRSVYPQQIQRKCKF